MNHGSLFSGIGGFDLASEWMGWENIFHCEWNEFGQRVLKHYWPKAITYGDITKTDFTIHRGHIDILTGGFPCQPFSIAGNKLGSEDDRELSGEYNRAVEEIKPRWVVAENVGNILNKKFQNTVNSFCTNLENKGYKEPLVFDCSADSVGLPTMERHIWIITQANGKRPKGCFKEKIQDFNPFAWKFQRSDQGDFRRWELSKSRVSGMGEGVPDQLDIDTISKTKWHSQSIKAYGNAIPPQVAYQIFKAIEQYETAH